MNRVRIYQGIADTLPFRIKDLQTRRALDLSGATFRLWVKREPEDSEAIFTKEDSDFIKTAASSGFISTFITPHDTWQDPWVYQAQLMITMPADDNGNIRVIKALFELEIVAAAVPNDWVLQSTGLASQESFGQAVITNI
jgi:hypothetical protein